MDKKLRRIKNQALIALDTSTTQGRNKLVLLVLWFCMGCYILSNHTKSFKSNYSVNLQIISTKSEFVLVDEDNDNDESSFFVSSDEEEENDFLSDDADSDEKSISEIVQDQQKMRLKSNGPKLLSFFKKYRTLKDLTKHLKVLSEIYEPLSIITEEIVGRTATGKQIKAYKVGKSPTMQSVVVVGLEHSAEWPAFMSLIYFLTRAVQLYSINDEITKTLDNLNFYVIPVLNIEGFIYSTSSKRHRFEQFNRNKKSKGVDLAVDYGRFSQKETISLRNWIHSKPDVIGFLSVHCCEQSVIIPALPECFTKETKSDILRVGKQITSELDNSKIKYKFLQQKAKKKKKKTKKLRGKIEEVFAINWANEELNVKYSYMIEGRGNSQRKGDRLALPENEILSVSREITKAILNFGSVVLNDENVKTTGCEPEVSEEEEEEEYDENDLLQSNFDDVPVKKRESFGESQDIDNTEETESESDDENFDGEGEDEGNFEEDQTLDIEEENNKDNEETSSFENDDASGAEHVEAGEEDNEIFEDENGGEEEDVSSYENSDEEDIEKDENLNENFEDENDNDGESFEEEEEEDSLAEDEDIEDEIKFTKPTLDDLVKQKTTNSEEMFCYFAYNHDMLPEILKISGVSSAIAVGEAKLEGYSMDYTYHSRKTWSSGIADIFKRRVGVVYGVVFEVSETEKHLLKQHNLDFSASRSNPELRWKKSRMREATVPIVLESSGESRECMTFKVRERIQGQEVFKRYRRFLPSRQYKHCLLKAFETWNFPDVYTERISKIPTMISDKVVGKRSKFRNKAIGDICD